MTFAEYNTDANFDNDKSSLDELVKIGVSEGKSADEIKSSLSPKWQKSKKIGEFDNYYKTYTAPKEEVTEEEKVATPIKEDVNLKKRDKEYLDNTNAKATYQEQKELDKVIDNKDADYAQTFDSIKRSGEMFRSIDDHMVENLPTFMFKRYQNGDFGDPKGKDAKLRMAYFMINGVGTALQNASASIKGGQMQDSDYETYKKTNMTQGLENRWNKYRQDTQAAIDLAKNRNMTEEEAYDSVKKISRNQRLQTAFNMMNEDQKLYLMNVTKEIGDKIGSFDNNELIDFLTGAAVSGDKLTWQEAAAIAVAKFGPDVYKAAKAGKDKVSGDDVTAGIGGSGNAKKGDTVLYDGTVIKNVGKLMSDKEFNQVASAADKLREDYNSGKIDKETFNSEYAKLEDIMKDHKLYTTFKKNLKSAETSDKEVTVDKWNELSSSLEELNANAKNMSKDDYLEQYEDLKAKAVKWGIGDKELKAMEKGKEKSLKEIEKASKKK